MEVANNAPPAAAADPGTISTAPKPNADSAAPPYPTGCSVPVNFPDKLMLLLDKKAAPDAVYWLRDMGDVVGPFAINRKAFTVQLLNKSFNGNKFPSITRNLNRW